MTLAPLLSWESGGAIKNKGGRGHGKRARKGKKVGEKEKRGEGQWVKKEGGGRGKEREREKPQWMTEREALLQFVQNEGKLRGGKWKTKRGGVSYHTSGRNRYL